MTSDEQIDIPLPQPGSYALLVHGFETDQVAGGPGANYSLFTWSIGLNDAAGNLTRRRRRRRSRTATASTCSCSGRGSSPGSRYLGAISHTTPNGLYDATVVNVVTP